MNFILSFFRSFQDIVLEGFRAEEYSRTREIKIFAIWFSLFVLTSFLLLAFNPDQGLHANVNFHMFQQVITQIANDNPVFGLTANFLIYGSTDFAVNGKLLPAYFISAQFPPFLVPIVAFTIFSVELFVSIYVSCRLFRLPVYLSLIAAWLAGLFYMPFVSPRLIEIELYQVVSFLVTASCAVMLFAALFYRLGKSGTRSSLAIGCGLFLIASYVTMAFLYFGVVIGYNIFWICLPLFIFASSLKERAVKIAVALVIGAIYYGLFYDYVTIFYQYNFADAIDGKSRSIGILAWTIWGQIINLFVSLDAINQVLSLKFLPLYVNASHRVSSSLSYLFPLSFLYISISSGFFYAVFFANRITSNVFQLSIAFLFGLLGCAIWWWGYHEAMIAPLYLISFVLGAVGIAQILAYLLKQIRAFFLKQGFLFRKVVAPLVETWIRFRGDFLGGRSGFVVNVPAVTARGFVFCMMGGILAAFVAYKIHVMPDMSWLYVYGKKPQLESFRILERQIGINISPSFRGRMVNLALIDVPQRFWNDPQDPSGATMIHDVFNAQLDADQDIARRFGGDYRRTAIQQRIPILFDVNRFTGAGTAAIMVYLLNEKNDKRYPELYNASIFNRRVLELMGVRFVLTSAPLAEGPKVVLREKDVINKRLTVYLYELPGANIGTFSPTRQIVVSTAREALDLMGDPTFDFRDSVVVHERVPGVLTRAKNPVIAIERNRLSIQAESTGKSLIVLPFEFSHCLVVENKQGETGPVPQLVRVNLHQIGMVFERRAGVNIRFRYTPLETACRRRDAEEDKKLKFSELATYKGSRMWGGYAP